VEHKFLIVLIAKFKITKFFARIAMTKIIFLLYQRKMDLVHANNRFILKINAVYCAAMLRIWKDAVNVIQEKFVRIAR
jgi:hypothetical protein